MLAWIGWGRRHKYLSATILIGGVVLLWTLGGGATGSDFLNRAAGALAFLLLLGLITYALIAAAKRLPDLIDAGASVMYALAVLGLFLVGLFVFIWIIKRIWEAA